MSNSTKPWNGQISNIRISNTADKELFNDLSTSTHRERARRLRTLATIGLLFLNQSQSNNYLQVNLPGKEKNELTPTGLEQDQLGVANRSSLSKLKNSL